MSKTIYILVHRDCIERAEIIVGCFESFDFAAEYAKKHKLADKFFINAAGDWISAELPSGDSYSIVLYKLNGGE